MAAFVDRRPDVLLEEHGRRAWRLKLALAWTDSLIADGAKACTRSGSAAWKAAARLPGDEEAAAAYFKTRARVRNPAVVASASGLVLVELDGPDELLTRFGINLPATVTVVSRRGRHRYYYPPPGRQPRKVQISEGGLIDSSDGYTIGAVALHKSGHVYYYDGGADTIATLPVDVYELIVRLGEETGEREARTFLAGDGEIPEGRRNDTIFHLALEQVRAGRQRGEILEGLQGVNRERCRPPLDDRRVAAQVIGAVKWARTHPTDQEQLRAEARRVLDERRAGGALHATPGTSGLFLPFIDVRLTGPPQWVWRGKVPQSAVSLLAGRPKQGKSLLTVWLAAQLSRGLLDGNYRDTPARTLLIAAEDPADTIVKPRLVAARADQRFVGTLAVQDRQGRHDSPRTKVGGLDGSGAYARRVTIPDEYELLEQVVVENEIALLVLDPINSFISARIDSHRDAEVRRFLDPLGAMAARHGFAAVCVVHLNKRADTDVLTRIIGSTGYGGSARSILTFGRHPENLTSVSLRPRGTGRRKRTPTYSSCTRSSSSPTLTPTTGHSQCSPTSARSILTRPT
jgi:hypothetical protein